MQDAGDGVNNNITPPVPTPPSASNSSSVRILAETCLPRSAVNAATITPLREVSIAITWMVSIVEYIV